MGRMILCRGALANRPYAFKLSGTRVYSIEELCHYIYHNIYEVTEDVFNETMVAWLKEEAKLPLLADRLKNMLEAESGLRDLVVNVFHACDYYTEEEIKRIAGLVDEFSHKPYYGRLKIKADNYIKYKKYGMAIQEYEKLLNGGMVGNLSPDEYGDVLHNLSVAYVHVDRLEDAIRGFKTAFLSNQRKETFERYLYALLISERWDELEKEIASMGWEKEKVDEYKDHMKHYLAKAEDMAEIKKLSQEWTHANQMDEDGIPSNANQYIVKWKTEYRERLT